MILNGPASLGRWPDYKNDQYMKPKKRTDLYRFCKEMEASDLVVLRVGTSKVHAVGEIVGSYKFH